MNFVPPANVEPPLSGWAKLSEMWLVCAGHQENAGFWEICRFGCHQLFFGKLTMHHGIWGIRKQTLNGSSEFHALP